MDSKEFDKKFNELRDIEARMKFYNENTPIKRVLHDQQLAQSIYEKLFVAIAELKSNE